MDTEVAELLAAYYALCARAGVEPLPEEAFEEWLRACLAERSRAGASLH